MTSIYAPSRQFAFARNRRVEMRTVAAALHAGILRAVAASDKKGAEDASERMMSYLRNYAKDLERGVNDGGRSDGRARPKQRNGDGARKHLAT